MLQDMGPFRRKTIKHYCSTMNAPDTHAVFDDRVAAILTTLGLTWSEDPRSIYDPQQLYTALERYATDWSSFEGMDSYLDAGFDMAYKIFAKPRGGVQLDVLNDSELVKEALHLEKSSGLPLMTTKAESLVYSFDREKQVRLNLKAPNPCVAYKRTQKNNKTRLVWGYPLEMTIIEARFARPLIDKFKTIRTPYAMGCSTASLGAYIHNYIVQSKGEIVCLDYSKYDSTISRTMIERAFRILSTWFRREDMKEYGWEKMVHYFINTPIVMPDGHLYRGKNHGVPSGSFFTNLIDSIVNVALIYALAVKFKLSINPNAVFVMGDDSIFNCRGEVNLSAWSDYLAKWGIQLSTESEKNFIGIPHFLGAVWTKGKPDVDIETLTAKAVFPERFRDYQGKPDEGAQGVLWSYATVSLTGAKLLPILRSNVYSMRNLDMPADSDSSRRHLTGSDKYRADQARRSWGHADKVSPTSIVKSYLL